MRVTSVAVLAIGASSTAAFAPFRFLNHVPHKRRQEGAPLADARHPWAEGGMVIRDDPPDDNQTPAGEQGESEARTSQQDSRKRAAAESRPKTWLVQTAPTPVRGGAESTQSIRNPPVRSDRRNPVRRRPPLTRTPGSTPEWAVPVKPITQRAAEAKRKEPLATPKREISRVDVKRIKPPQPAVSNALRTVDNQGGLPSTDARSVTQQPKKQPEAKRVNSPDLSSKENTPQDSISYTEITGSNEDYLPHYFSEMNQKMSSKPLTPRQPDSVAAANDATDISKFGSEATVSEGFNGSVSPPPAANPVNIDNTARTKPVDQAEVNKDDNLNAQPPEAVPKNEISEFDQATKPEKVASTVNAPAKKKWLSSLRNTEPNQTSASNSSPSFGPVTRQPVRTIRNTPASPNWPMMRTTSAAAMTSNQKPVGKIGSPPMAAMNANAKSPAGIDTGSIDSTRTSKLETSERRAPSKKWLSSLRSSEPNREAGPSSPLGVGTNVAGSRNEKSKSSTPGVPNRIVQSSRMTGTTMKPKPTQPVDMKSNTIVRPATSTESASTDSRPGKMTPVEAVSNEQKYAEKARELERRVSMLREQRRLAEERRQKEREGQSNAVAAGVSIKQPEIPSKGSKKPANEEVTTSLEGAYKSAQSNRTSAANKPVISADSKDSGSTRSNPIGTDPWIELIWPGTPTVATTAVSPSPLSDSPKLLNATKESKPVETEGLKSINASKFPDEQTSKARKQSKQREALFASDVEAWSLLKVQGKLKDESYINQRALLAARFVIEKREARKLAESKLKALEQARVAAEIEARRNRELQGKTKRKSYINQRSLLSTRFEIEEKEARNRRAEEEARVAAELESQRIRDAQEKAKRKSYTNHRALLSTRFEFEEKEARSQKAEKEARVAAKLDARRIRHAQKIAKRKSYLTQRTLLATRLEIEEQEAKKRKAEEESRVAAKFEAQRIRDAQERAKRKSYFTQRTLVAQRLKTEQEIKKRKAEEESRVAAKIEERQVRDEEEKAKRESYLKQRALLDARLKIEEKERIKGPRIQRKAPEEARAAGEVEAESIALKRESYLKQRALLAARFEIDRKTNAEEGIAHREGFQFQERILKLENELQEVQSRIIETERQIADGSDDWASEDISFALKIAELTSGLEDTGEDAKERQITLQKAYQQRQIELYHELEQFKGTLDEIQRALQHDDGTYERLTQKLESQMKTLDEVKQERDKCRTGNYRLRKQIVSKRIERRSAEERKVEEKLDFKADRTDLETRVMSEKTKLLELSKRLRMERIAHEKELSILERRLLREKTKRSIPNLKQEREAELTAKLRMYTSERERLQERISYEKRARDVKTRELVERKESIQKELTKLCQGAKDSATRERQAIVEKYEAELSVLTDLLKRLQNKKQAIADARQLTDHVNMLKQQRRQEEQDFVRQLTARNNIISDLTGNLPTLESELQNRDKIIEEYETDFCKILKQSVKICREYFQG